MPISIWWLTATPDGRNLKIIRAATAEGAIKSRFRNEDDCIRFGMVAAWRLGAFPAQFEVAAVGEYDETAGYQPFEVRPLGNPRVGTTV